MTSDIQEHYDTYFDLFMTDGWKQFIKFAEESKERIYNIEQIKDENSLHNTQGQLFILTNIINFESMNRAAYENNIADEMEDEEDEDV